MGLLALEGFILGGGTEGERETGWEVRESARGDERCEEREREREERSSSPTRWTEKRGFDATLD